VTDRSGADGDRPDEEQAVTERREITVTSAGGPLPDGDRPQSSKIASAISRELVRLHSKRLGRGPTKARVITNTNIVTAIFEDSLTRSEHTLLSAGRDESVLAARQTLDRAMRQEAVSIVEALTHRTVKAHVAGIDVDANVSVMTFLLDPIEEEGTVGIAEINTGDGPD
jgi:uncharacterized protein YbcI